MTKKWQWCDLGAGAIYAAFPYSVHVGPPRGQYNSNTTDLGQHSRPTGQYSSSTADVGQYSKPITQYSSSTTGL